MIPLFGGPLAFGACAALPIGWQLGLIALVVDPACALTLVLLLSQLRRRSGSS